MAAELVDHRRARNLYKISIAFLLAALIFSAADRFMSRLRSKFALATVQLFSQMQADAERSADPSEIASKLKYTIWYYPAGPGSRVGAGSNMELMVEAARSNTVTILVQRLRQVTKQDLGANPKPWLDRYLPAADRPASAEP